MKRSLVRFHGLLNQFGLDPRKLVKSLIGFPRYLRDFFHFRSGYTGRINFLPYLHDWYEEGGTTATEYFWQDLVVARMIFAAAPEKHVDVGSRVDGFVAHIASFREIEVFDVRPISAQIPGVIFKQSDLMSPVSTMESYCDSLSCLHALEHFGLGRYGDPVDPKGYERGLANMARLLTENGVCYLSVPIGVDRVEFNAHRVFDPRVIIDLALQHSLEVRALSVIQPNGKLEVVTFDEPQLSRLANQQYALGLFVFHKTRQL